MTEHEQNATRSEQQETQLPTRRKRRKIKKLPIIILVIVMAFIAMIIYSVHSYNKGIKFAEKHGHSMKVQKFDGAMKNDGKVSIMLLGADMKDGGVSRTDSIMVAQYDFIHKRMKIVSVMRDIYADIPGYRHYKINSAYSLGGAELLRKTLKKNLGIDPEYYAVVDFEGFEKMVDELEPQGVPINVEKDMSKNIGVSLKKGNHRLNGKELLGYARFRHDAEGDFGRVRRQQQVIQALKQEMASLQSIAKVPKMAGILRGYVETDLPNATIFQTGTSFILRGDKKVDTLSVPIKNTYEDIQTPESGSALQIDKAANKKAIEAFLND